MSRLRLGGCLGLRAFLSPAEAGSALTTRVAKSAWVTLSAKSAQVDTLLSGCGFALGLGWLWFAGLGELWRDSTADFLALRDHEGLLVLSFGAGCLVFGFAAGWLNKHSRECPGLLSLFCKSTTALTPTSVLAHGGALLCLGLLCAADLPPASEVMLVGLAEAAFGIYWLSRVLLLGAARAVAALAWAYLASLLMSELMRALPPGSGIAFGLAGCVLVAWLLAFTLESGTAKNATISTVNEAGTGHPNEQLAGSARTRPGGMRGALPPGMNSWTKRESALCIALGLAFFNLGAIYALPMDYRAGGGGPFALEAVSALLEAAGLGTFAALAHRSGIASYTQRTQAGGIARLAGFFLAALALAVNAGYAVGQGIVQAHGAWGMAFFIAALILLLLLVSSIVVMTAKRHGMAESMNAAGGPCPPQSLKPPKSATDKNPAVPFVSAESGIQAVPAKIREEIAQSFNTKEQTVATLLVQGHTNKKIAEYLSVTENAVRWHIKNLNKKTGATNRRQLLDMLTRVNTI